MQHGFAPSCSAATWSGLIPRSVRLPWRPLSKQQAGHYPPGRRPPLDPLSHHHVASPPHEDHHVL